MKYLHEIESPKDLKQLPESALPELCAEIREYLISVVTEVGGHFASSLGAVELTVALHYVYDAPADKMTWEEAIQYCEDLQFAGQKDWKLPSNKELTSLVDLRKQKPAIDTSVFQDVDYKAYYWSRTQETRDASRNLMSETTVQPEDLQINNANENAWAQSFMLGAAWRAPRRMLAYARCMRWVE